MTVNEFCDLPFVYALEEVIYPKTLSILTGIYEGGANPLDIVGIGSTKSKVNNIGLRKIQVVAPDMVSAVSGLAIHSNRMVVLYFQGCRIRAELIGGVLTSCSLFIGKIDAIKFDLLVHPRETRVRDLINLYSGVSGVEIF